MSCKKSKSLIIKIIIIIIVAINLCQGNAPAENLPVMVWFHSGDFNTGTPALWNPTILVSRSKVICC